MTEVVKRWAESNPYAIQIPYTEIHREKKWGKTKEKDRAGYEASTFLWHEISAKITRPKYISR